MRRRLNREEFLADLGVDLELQPAFLWPVFGRYELLDGQDNRRLLPDAPTDIQAAVRSAIEAAAGSSQDAKFPYFRAAEDNLIELYEPLSEVPHLFLEFSRAGERDDPEALRDWIAKRGLLGLHRIEPDKRPLSGIMDHGYSPAGGPGDALPSVQFQAWKASQALIAWEAVLSKDKEQLEEALFGRREKLRPLEESRQASRERFKSSARSSGTPYADALLNVAVLETAQIVQEAVEAFAYPSLELDFPRQPDAPYGPELLRRTWRPRNLLGAIYLQFYWLITSTGELSRCKQCNRLLLSGAPPISAAGKIRKPRKDKEFCDSRCRQNYHYHARLKPARQGKKP